MSKYCDLILLRHAEAEHNVEKLKLSKNQKVKGKKSPEFTNLKKNMKFRDERITHIGLNQCQEVSDILDWSSIAVIFVSPLRRCLDTCRQILQRSNVNIKVIVQPTISAKVSNAWSIGSSKQQLQKQYPQFSFERLKKDCNKLPWYLSSLCALKQKKILDLAQPDKLLELGIKQDFFQFRQRVQKFQRVLMQFCNDMKQGSRILIISHNKVFGMMTAKFFDEKGKSSSDLKFHNAQIKYVPSSKIFHPLCPSPSL